MSDGFIIKRGSSSGDGKDYSAFRAIVNRSITKVTAEMLKGLTSIGDAAFYCCNNLTSLEIPNNITRIEDVAFNDCNHLTSIEIPNSVTYIGYAAFQARAKSELERNVIVGTGVIRIGGLAFAGFSDDINDKFTSFTIKAISPPDLGNKAFDDNPKLVIYVPAESLDAYKAASGWSSYANIIQAIPN